MNWPFLLFATCGRRYPAALVLIPTFLISMAGPAERPLVVQPPGELEKRPASLDSSRHTAFRFQQCSARRVPREELLRAMAQHGDFDILATTNRGRFSSELILRLGREALARDPQGGPIHIDPDDWFYSFLETAGVSEEDAPMPSRLGFENRQRVMIEYRRHHVIDEVKDGPEPTLALNVRTWWEEDENPASEFSFTDTTATPTLRVTSQREINYRLLEFDGMIVVDQIEGVSGRPVSGLLGALFDVIGEASVKHSRIAVSDDGVQVARATSKKMISVSVTATTEPDGHTSKGVPPDRPDLRSIEEQLMRPLSIRYIPYVWEPVCRVNMGPRQPATQQQTPS